MQVSEGRGFQVDGTAKSLCRGRPDLFQEQQGGQKQSRAEKGAEDEVRRCRSQIT